MIEFIKPYLDDQEIEVLKTKSIPIDLDGEDLSGMIKSRFYHGKIFLTDKGELAIQLAVSIAKQSNYWNHPTIAIPTVSCASVWRAVKNQGHVVLMDCDETWNCRYDEESAKAKIVIYENLGGLRMDPPTENHVVIDDSAQCFDGIIGPDGTDFSIYSFGNGKQMYAGGGGILYSNKYDFPMVTVDRPPAWQKWLIHSQLNKIDEINRLRIRNGLRLIEGLKDLPWIRIPKIERNVFSKFVVFIDQGGKSFFEVRRTDEILRFMRYMYERGVQVEETYIPLHIRFPESFPEARYRDFNANRLWPEAITLPCRPNLSKFEIDQIIDAVRRFEPKTQRPPMQKQSDKSGLIFHLNNCMEDYSWIKNICVCPWCGGPLSIDFMSNTPQCIKCFKLFRISDKIPVIVRNASLHLKQIENLSIVNPNWYKSDQTAYYDGGPYKVHLNRRRTYIESVIKRIIFETKMKRFLDLGCGDGQNLRWLVHALSKSSAEIYATDYNLERLIKAISLVGESTKIFLSTFDDPCLIEGAFDLIFFNHVLEHIHDDVGALSTVYRSLSKGGHVILGVPNEGSAWWQLAYRLEPITLEETDHVNFYTGPELKAKCESVGFVVEELEYMGYGLPHWSADSFFKGVEGADDVMEQIGRKFFREQASSMYLILRKL